MATDCSQSFTTGGRTFSVAVVEVERIVDLRWKILRQGLPRDEARFEGDDALTSLHVAVAEGDRVLSCATFHANAWEGGESAFQLRGMATDSDCRGLGLGRRLLQFAEGRLLERSPVWLLWCNARTPALDFYLKQGWEIRSDLFHIPTAGPHRKMTKRLNPTPNLSASVSCTS